MKYIKKHSIPAIKTFIIGIALIICSWMAYLLIPGPLTEERIVIINPRTPIIRIAKELHAEGVIYQPWAFVLIAKIYNHVKGPLKSGEYQFTSNVTPLQVIRILASGDSMVRKFIIPEGSTVHEILSQINGEPRLIGEIQENIVEGMIMPSTYFYTFQDQRNKIITTMKKLMSDTLDELMPQLAKDSPLKTRADVLILASIVEKEALFDEERPRIAAVFLNRLKKKMKLQADPTTIYSITLGKSKLGRLLTKADLKTASKFNTYHAAGLPPTPIACPGRKSIEAVIKPSKTNEIYFVVDGTGRHKFSATLEAHIANVAAYKAKNKNTVIPNTSSRGAQSDVGIKD